MIIVSDYNFQTQITEKSKWLSGIKVNGENLSGIDALTSELQDSFEQVLLTDLTRVIADAARNFNVSQCQLSVWRAL